MANSLNFLQSAQEEDFVEYFVYPPITACKDTKEEESTLNSILKQIEKTVEKHSASYLWHRDGFKLVPRTSNYRNLLVDASGEDAETQPHLHGVSHYGDNIEDEWFIVFLLFQITQQIDDLIVRVADVDGEFLLIEAADYLPAWANPETCERRVYIYQGRLHIVAPQKVDNHVVVDEALAQIRRMPEATLASVDIQNSILNKIKGYPERITDNFHSTSVYLPVGVAALLKHKPGLVAAATQAFCNRDPVDLKACRAMKYFPPENRVYSRVPFTKCLYAMLNHSKYLPDKRTGWNLPLVNSPQYKAHSLGVKLACGFEILISQAKPSENVDNDRGWHSYLKSLQGRNYFRGLLEHSRDYNDLLNKAKEYYINYRDSMHSVPLIGQEVLDLTKNLDYNIEELKKDEANLPGDEDDSWLNIDPKALDKMLEEQYGQKPTINGNTDAATFTQKITQFLDHVSDIEGAEFPNNTEKSPLRPARGIKRRGKSKVSFSSDTKVEEKPNANNKINFDPSAFTCALQNILDFMIPDDDGWDLDSDSDMSAYGEEQEASLEACEDFKTKMQEYMEQMDKELAQTAVGQSFHKVERADAFEDVESFRPVDIDMNALKNVLESYQAEMGEAGPASNMLGPMGIHLQPGTSHEACFNKELD